MLCLRIKISEKPNSENIVEQIFTVNKHEALNNLYNYKDNLNNITLGVWNKLYKKELFNEIRFKVGKIHEDDYIIHQILDRANTVVYSNIPLYYYFQRTSSITGQKFNIKRLDRLGALEERIVYFKERGYDELYNMAYDDYLSNLINDYYLVKRFCPEEKAVYEDLRNEFLKLNRNRDNVVFSKKLRVKYTLFSLSPLLSKFVGRTFQILKRIISGSLLKKYLIR